MNWAAPGFRRGIRGGSWGYDLQFALVGSRYADDPGYRYGRDFCLRLARRVS